MMVQPEESGLDHLRVRVVPNGLSASTTTVAAMTQTNEDPRPVPPLGWCAECIREAGWNRAATLWEGTALCAQHLIYKAGIGDIDIEEENAPMASRRP